MVPAAAALCETWESLGAVASGLEDSDWALPTDCPGWSVQDHIAHVAAAMLVLAGRPEPDADVPSGGPHVRNPLGEYWEARVEARRGRPGADVAAELAALTQELVPAVSAFTEASLSDTVEGPMGFKMPRGQLIAILAFDMWVHEQDVRRAAGQPGQQNGPAVDHAIDQIASGLARALGEPELGLPDGTVVAFCIGDDGAGRVVAIGVADGEGHPLADEPADPTVRIAVDLPGFVAITTGRRDADAAGAIVDGDGALAKIVLDNVVVTP
jgi:uncharacterized protein (TIGR03083 family)